MDLGDAGYNEGRARQFYSQLVERVSALPGVESVGLSQISPFSGGGLGSMVRPADRVQQLEFAFNRISSKYFQTLGIPLLSGRDFAPLDVAGGLLVTIINESAAHRFWPHGDAVGKRLQLKAGPDDWQAFEIIGVVADSKSARIAENVRPSMYVSLSQFHSSGLTLHVRTVNATNALTASLRATLQGLDPHLPVANVKTLDEQISGTLSSERMIAGLLTAFGMLALALAAVGIYGVLAFAVSRRTHEIGVRLALGAQEADVLGLVLSEGMKLAGVGIVLGLFGAFAFSRLLRSVLFGVEPTDPGTFAVIPVLLILVALLACWLPARRATRVDPVVALRCE